MKMCEVIVRGVKSRGYVVVIFRTAALNMKDQKWMSSGPVISEEIQEGEAKKGEGILTALSLSLKVQIPSG